MGGIRHSDDLPPWPKKKPRVMDALAYLLSQNIRHMMMMMLPSNQFRSLRLHSMAFRVVVESFVVLLFHVPSNYSDVQYSAKNFVIKVDI